MSRFDEWTKLEEDEEQELYDQTRYETKRDVILFCIDCSKSMLHSYDDPKYEDVLSSHVLTALEAAVQIQKRKVLVGPNDSVGILLYNVDKLNEAGEGTELRRGVYVYQRIGQISADKVIDLNQLIDEARKNPEHLREMFPSTERKVPLNDVFTSCNWVMRDDAPKTASKRIFLITDDDDPHPTSNRERLVVTAHTTLKDLIQSGISVEPFFISTDDRPFDRTKFWTSVLLPTTTDAGEDADVDTALPEHLSITRIDDLLDQLRFYEVPKRAHFSVPFTLVEDFTIGVKGYNLVVEQKKSTYKYFSDLGDRIEVAESRTFYVDEEFEEEVDKNGILFGVALGATADDKDAQKHGFGAREVDKGCRVFYTVDEIKAFRTLGLSPGLKLLGFKQRGELRLEHNVKHSTFLFPNEAAYSGSKRTFSALVQSMLEKRRIALVLGVVRSNASPTFYAALPQAEVFRDGAWVEPAGLHLVALPFADDVREARIQHGARASEGLVQAMRPIVRKLELKSKAYVPESYPNPALALHNAQLEASAFREEYDPDDFVDLSLPRYASIHKKIGPFVPAWKEHLDGDPTVAVTTTAAAAAAATTAGSKRKAETSVDEVEIRSKYEAGALAKLLVDQLKQFLRSKGESVSGKKAELLERAAAWLEAHPG